MKFYFDTLSICTILFLIYYQRSLGDTPVVGVLFELAALTIAIAYLRCNKNSSKNGKEETKI